jgi:uncharacterized repeat protein (TIGR01451 family)
MNSKLTIQNRIRAIVGFPQLSRVLQIALLVLGLFGIAPTPVRAEGTREGLPNANNCFVRYFLLPTDLAITNVVSNATPMVGAPVTFTLTATNNGANATTGVNVAALLPTGYTFVSAAGGSYDAATGVWTIGALANGANATLVLTAIVLPTGTYTTNATISGNDTDPVMANNTAAANVTPLAATPAITVVSAQPSACSLTNNQYDVNVLVAYENPPAGNIVLTTDNGASQSFAPSAGTSTCFTPVCLNAKAYFAGAFVSPSDVLMRDDLRQDGYLPTTEPYSAFHDFVHTNGGGGETVSAAVLAVTGNNAIVDWVFLELRTSPTTVYATKAALIQRDGDIVSAADGTSPVTFNAPAGNYYVVVRHRNHFGLMTANAITFGAACANVDFTVATTDVWNETTPDDYTGAERYVLSGKLCMFPGDVNGDTKIQFMTGGASDVDVIKNKVLTAPGNPVANQAYTVYGYERTDVNLDTKTLFQGPTNDPSVISFSLWSCTVNTAFSLGFVMREQLPAVTNRIVAAKCFKITGLVSNGLANIDVTAAFANNSSITNTKTDAYSAPALCKVVEICNNGIDDDGNGLTDCIDPACNCPAPATYGRVCGDVAKKELLRHVFPLRNGGAVAVGYQEQPATSTIHALAIRLDNDGNTVWTKTYSFNATRNDFLSGTECANGDIMLAGWTTTSPNSYNTVVRVNAADGSIIWQNLQDNPYKGGYVRTIMEEADGRLLVAGVRYSSTNASDGHSYTYHLSSDGAIITDDYLRRFSTLNGGGTNDVSLPGMQHRRSWDNKLIGSASHAPGTYDPNVTLYRNNGTAVWSKNYYLGSQNDDGYVFNRNAAENGYMLMGDMYYAGKDQMYGLRLDTSGNVLRHYRYTPQGGLASRQYRIISGVQGSHNGVKGYVVAATDVAGGAQVPAMMFVNEYGVPQWIKGYNPLVGRTALTGALYGVCQTYDGGYLAVGVQKMSATDDNMLIVKAGLNGVVTSQTCVNINATAAVDSSYTTSVNTMTYNLFTQNSTVAVSGAVATPNMTCAAYSCNEICGDGFDNNGDGNIDEGCYNPDFNVTNVNKPLNGNVNTNDNVSPSSVNYGNPIIVGTNPSADLPTINNNGSYTFTTAVKGVYHFNVPVCPIGQSVGCPLILLTITVLDPNDVNPPVANPESVITNMNTQIDVDVLRNDRTGNPLGILRPASTRVTASAANGNVVVSSVTGIMTYFPYNNFTGDDVLTYEVCDNSTPSLCATTQVNFRVLPLTNPNNTFAADDYAHTEHDTPVSGNLKTNDTDAQGHSQSITPQNNVLIAGKGTITIDAAGNYTFTPLSTFSGHLDVIYQTCDNAVPPACATATLHILVEENYCTGTRPPVLLSLGLDKTLFSFCDENGWIYYRATRGATNSMIAIHPNGNAFDPQTVKIDAIHTAGLSQTGNSNTTTLADRMIHIVAPGAYPLNGGMKVRIFYDATEFVNLPTTRRTWFKHEEHDKNTVATDLSATDLNHANPLTPVTDGTENGVTFVEFHGITSFSTFGYLGSTNTNVLPVKLLSFKGFRNAKTNDLKWTTSTELNNDKFEIQRSADGNIWKNIGTVNGSGTTSSNTHYTFTDEYPLAGYNYYRLRQIDFDGKSEFSNSIVLQNTQQTTFTVAPNPIRSEATITLSAPAQNATMALIDVLGRVLLSQNIPAGATTHLLSTDGIVNGTYFIKVLSDGKSSVERVVIAP